MTSRIAVLLCFLCSSIAFGQIFKEVTTAQDVINNYIESIGGADAVKELKSVRMKGSIEAMGQTGALTVYLSKNYFYLEVSSDAFQVKQAVDLKNKNGWSSFGGMVKDMNENDIARTSRSVNMSMWSYYLYPEKYGIKYELLQNEKVNGNDAYVVDFKSGDSVIATSYYDAKTFLKLRQTRGTEDSEYSDFREVGLSNVKMAYSIKNQSGDVTVSEIKFNEKFDKKLLVKPEEKQ